jgi:hypothetical protein
MVDDSQMRQYMAARAQLSPRWVEDVSVLMLHLHPIAIDSVPKLRDMFPNLKLFYVCTSKDAFSEAEESTPPISRGDLRCVIVDKIDEESRQPMLQQNPALKQYVDKLISDAFKGTWGGPIRFVSCYNISSLLPFSIAALAPSARTLVCAGISGVSNGGTEAPNIKRIIVVNPERGAIVTPDDLLCLRSMYPKVRRINLAMSGGGQLTLRIRKSKFGDYDGYQQALPTLAALSGLSAIHLEFSDKDNDYSFEEWDQRSLVRRLKFGFVPDESDWLNHSLPFPNVERISIEKNVKMGDDDSVDSWVERVSETYKAMFSSAASARDEWRGTYNRDIKVLTLNALGCGSSSPPSTLPEAPGQVTLTAGYYTEVSAVHIEYADIPILGKVMQMAAPALASSFPLVKKVSARYESIVSDADLRDLLAVAAAWGGDMGVEEVSCVWQLPSSKFSLKLTGSGYGCKFSKMTATQEVKAMDAGYVSEIQGCMQRMAQLLPSVKEVSVGGWVGPASNSLEKAVDAAFAGRLGGME